MKINIRLIKKFIDRLEAINILASIISENSFFDEPKFFKYTAYLNFSKVYSDAFPPNRPIVANGYSTQSRNLALIKCLGEALERLNLYTFKEKDILFSQRSRLKFSSLNVSRYNISDNNQFGWIKGYNLTKREQTLIPAQMVYLGYGEKYKEKFLTTNISTGAAGGFLHNEVLLRGIYEVVERDCFMTAYLNQLELSNLNINNVLNLNMEKILDVLERYRLKIKLFEITNDLNIPCFLTIILDKTPNGPTFSLGLKSSFDTQAALLGSIEESLMGRFWLKSLTLETKKASIALSANQLFTLKNRALYWSGHHMAEKLSFWLKSKKKEKALIKHQKPGNLHEELNYLIHLLKSRGYEIYYADISSPITSGLNYLTYKVLIPGLQPLYLDERKKEIYKERLISVAKFFGLNNYRTNPIPHPFL